MEKYLFKSKFGEINVYIKDNQAKDTVLFIHGLNSSHLFARDIYELANHFNIITFDFPFRNASFESLVEITKEIIANVYEGSGLIVAGHSMGGAIALSLEDKIIERILIAPVNPSLAGTKRFAITKKVIKPTTKSQKAVASIAMHAAKKIAEVRKNQAIKDILGEKFELNPLITDSIFDEKFLSEDLDALFKQKHALYVIGNKDPFISPSLFIEYVEKMGKRVTVIDGALHNPFASKSLEMYTYLNSLIPKRKRFFWNKKFYSKKCLIDN